LRKGGRRQIVALLDAKYRDLWEHELKRDMLYQLAVYALGQPTGGTAAILYPTLAAGAREARIEICEPGGSWGRGYVVLRPVHLGQMAALVTAPDDRATREQRRALARALACGAEGANA
jgi:5-methylcytosine-specific restriction enzyme subunit McrC